ncbi:MAG TPA: Sir2 family NAD-dependent protein deacetylase, partial [Acidimicrobiia bacterium]
GLPEEEVAELHGNLRSARCLGCGTRWQIGEVLARVEGGEEDPACPHCGGIVKTSTVMFGEMLPPDQLERASRMTATADAVLAVGTTLSVFPAAGFAVDAALRGLPLVIINVGRTDQDELASVKIEEPAGGVLPQLVEALTKR